MSEQYTERGGRRAAEIIRKLKPVRDQRMRSVVLAKYLAGIPAEEAVEALATLVVRVAQAAAADHRMALECLTITLGDAVLLPYDLRAALYAAAKASGLAEVARLFFDASPQLSPAARLEADLGEARPVTPRGPALSLGERKALARSHRRDLLQHLVRDPHPDVVRILLGNPHLTEREVVVVATRRPAVAQALAEIAAHPRWGMRYTVKLALAQNPYTPVHLAIRLITTLRAADLHVIAGDSHLAPSLREQARALLGQR